MPFHPGTSFAAEEANPHLARQNKVSPEPRLFQAKQPHLPQPLLI